MAAFLSLPLEIRRIIYRYSLPHSKLDRRTDATSRFLLQPEDNCIRWYNGISPSLLFANRQIHAEACEVLYSENAFTIYVRHPRNPRLPMNESRADDDSFVFISWRHRHWAHPKNQKLPLAVLRNHINLSSICRIHVVLPNMNDLLPADVYMRTTSFASKHGVSAWVRRRQVSGGKLEQAEQERMDYINMTRGPINEVADVLKSLSRIKEIVLFLPCESFEKASIEFVISGLLQLRGVQRAQLLYREMEDSISASNVQSIKLRIAMMGPRLDELERQLESDLRPQASEKVAGLSSEAFEMLEMLESMRKRMLLMRQLRSEFLDSNFDLTIQVLGHIMAE